MRAAGIRAVTFDVGGTLLDSWPSVGHIYSRVAARHGYRQISPQMLNRRFRAAWRAFRGFRHTRRQWAELVDATFRGLSGVHPSRTFFPELFHRFADPRVWRIYDDVLPALGYLKARGLKLGVISNWDERLKPLLGRLGLSKYFDVVVVSCDVGITKPARRIFQAAAAELRLEPGEILHIGDHPLNDYGGARAAGFQAALLKRHGRITGVAQLASLRELEHRNFAKHLECGGSRRFS